MVGRRGMARETLARERLDGPLPSSALRATFDDLDRLNAWFGGYALTLSRVRRAEAPLSPGRRLVVVDVGGGRGDLAINVVRWARRRGRPVRVLLVDDHAMVRQGLRSILDGYPNLDIIAEAGDGEEAITLARLLKPDLIVMDVNMPRLDGIEATRRIREELPSTYVVGLSVNEAEHIVKSMKAAGAAAFLTKESAADHLYETIGAVTRKINIECSMDASLR